MAKFDLRLKSLFCPSEAEKMYKLEVFFIYCRFRLLLSRKKGHKIISFKLF